MDVSLMSQRLKDRLMAAGKAKQASIVKYVDPNDLTQFVVMPPWFKKITSLPGIPFKFITEFAGPPDSGKTTAGMIALISAQKSGQIAILIDIERKFNQDRFVAMGGDLDSLWVIQELTLEKTASSLESTLKEIADECPGVSIMVLYDSVSVGVTNAEMEKDIDSKQTIADKAKVIKRIIQRLIVLSQTCNAAVVCINQVYKDPNPMAHGGSKLSGGLGLEYAKSLALSFQKIGELQPKQSKGVKYKVGIKTKAKTIKNHLQTGDQIVSDLLLEIKANEVTEISADKKAKGKKATEDIPAELEDGDDDLECIEVEETIEE